MGSEHSAHLKQASVGHQSEKQTNLRRQHTIANPVSSGTEERSGSTSPGPSICSDSDLPYISYTVNRPIGDSPKLTNKQLPKSKGNQRKSMQRNIKKSVHNIVVVKPAVSSPNIDRDPDIVRLAVSRLIKIPIKCWILIGQYILLFIEHPDVFTYHASHFEFTSCSRSGSFGEIGSGTPNQIMFEVSDSFTYLFESGGDRTKSINTKNSRGTSCPVAAIRCLIFRLYILIISD